jgi:hypothetical protein
MGRRLTLMKTRTTTLARDLSPRTPSADLRSLAFICHKKVQAGRGQRNNLATKASFRVTGKRQPLIT